MSRDVSAAVTSAAQLDTIQYRWLVEVHSVSTGVTRACTGYQHIVFNGNTYAPVGHLGGVEKIQEDADIFPRAVRMWFAAVSTTQIQDVLNENLFNRPVKIFRTFLTDSYTNVATPEELFRGFINTCEMRLQDPQRGDYFEIEVESRLKRHPRAQYYDRETLWTTYNQSGDPFFSLLHFVPLTKTKWGLASGIGFGGSDDVPGSPDWDNGPPGSRPGG